MVIIRLARFGSKKKPFYRIIIADKRMPRNGRFIECIGSYNPMINKRAISLNLKRSNYWLNVGAQTTETVRSLMKIFKKSVKQ